MFSSLSIASFLALLLISPFTAPAVAAPPLISRSALPASSCFKLRLFYDGSGPLANDFGFFQTVSDGPIVLNKVAAQGSVYRLQADGTVINVPTSGILRHYDAALTTPNDINKLRGALSTYVTPPSASYTAVTAKWDTSASGYKLQLFVGTKAIYQAHCLFYSPDGRSILNTYPAMWGYCDAGPTKCSKKGNYYLASAAPCP